jgi:predicted Zn-dependent peptidase/predicted Ser/Thr protein kinase
MATEDGSEGVGTEVPTVAEPRARASARDSGPLPSQGDEPPESWLGGLAGLDHDVAQDTIPPGNEGPGPEGDAGLESRVLLARARSRLLGWDDAPVQIGRYRIVEPIGSGGMGVVYAAHDDELDRDVAIKVLRRDLAPGSAGRQRLVREAQATAKLSHPNVVHVYEVGQAGEQVYMAMELVRGATLRAWRKAAERSWREIVDMYRQAGEGLVAAHHEGIVHRDFKPDNVLVNHQGRPQIVDFGLARATHDGGAATTREILPANASGSRLRDFDITRTGTVVGTPAYMPPEQLARAEPDARSDQFSFCASLFEALYGERPFTGSTYSELERSLTRGRIAPVTRRNDVPKAIHAAVLRGLSPVPADRFATMRELLDALDRGQTTGRPIGWALGVVGAAGIAAAAWTQRPIAIAAVPATQAERTPAAEPAPPTAEDPWASIVAASDLPPLLPTPLPGDPAGVTVHRLRNGLTIYVARRPHEPVVASALVFRAGAAQEGVGEQGLAALTVNAALRGTDRLGVVDPEASRPRRLFQHALIEQVATQPEARDRLLAAIAESEREGAALEIPAELFDATSALGGRDPVVLGTHGPGPIIAAEVPRHRVGTWMQLHAEAVKAPVFRGFLDTVIDQLGFVGWFGDETAEALGRGLADATGLRHDRDANLALLERLPLADVRAFHDRYWRPNNAALVLVGDISAPEAVALAEQAFGDWEPAPIPPTEAIDRPLPGGRVAFEVENIGPPHLEIAWPMPPADAPEYDALVALGDGLMGRGGLLRSQLREKVAGWGAHVGRRRDFNLFIMLLPGQTPEDAEDAVLAGLQAIADDRVDDDAWRDALTAARYEQLRWARGPGSLLLNIADAFLTRRPWSTGSGRPAAAGPTRAEIVAAARFLLSRSRVVVHKKTGKAPKPRKPALPSASPSTPGPRSRRSEFARALLASPTTPTEPRFLVEGSHYETREHGAGRVVLVRTDSPLFHLSWIYPVGTAEDPWACEALHARMRLLETPGAEVSTFCTTTDTRYEVTASADRFAELMPSLLSFFDAGTIPPADAQEYAEHALRMRVESREQPFLRPTGAEFFGLLGEHGLDLQLPRDADLRHGGGAAMIAAFERMRQYDPDVLYAGPDPDAVVQALPAPKGKTSGDVYVRTYRRPAGPEVLFIDDPEHDGVTVRASVPWLARTPREHLAATMHREFVLDAEHNAPLAIDPDALGYRVGFSPGPPIAIGVGFQTTAAEVPAALDTALSVLGSRPTREGFDAARERLETAFRVDRTAPAKIPDLVYAWGRDAVDPRVAQWLALPSLGFDDVMAYYATLDATPPVLVVCGDARTIDFAALRRFGTLVRVDADDLLNDQMLSGFGRDMPLLIDE